MFYIRPLLASLSNSIKAGIVRVEIPIRSQSSSIMKFALPTLLLAAPVLGDLLYDAPFVGDPSLVARTTKGASCVGTLHIDQDSTNISISARYCRPSLVVKSRFLDLLRSQGSRTTL